MSYKNINFSVRVYRIDHSKLEGTANEILFMAFKLNIYSIYWEDPEGLR